MGVDRTDYLMFGADMGAKGFEYEKHEPECEGAPGRLFDIVYDGMCSKYCFAGKIIAKSDPYDGLELTKIEPEKLDVDRAELAEKVSASFGRKVVPDDFALMLFSHFS